MDASRPAPLTPLQWLICAVAALGFAFDSYELLMLPLIARPALADLLNVAPNSLEVNSWVGTLQYVPAVCGGIFGLEGESRCEEASGLFPLRRISDCVQGGQRVIVPKVIGSMALANS